MNIVGRRAFAALWGQHPGVKSALAAWYALVQKSDWTSAADVKAQFGTRVQSLKNDHLAFEISGMDYNLVVRVCYVSKIVAVIFAGTAEDFQRQGMESA